jgi:hypothetical protein
MTTSNFNLRNISPEVMSLLKKEAAKQKVSVNSLILQIVEQSLGFAYPVKKSLFHDLDYLSGTWTSEDENRFNKNSKTFEKIDEDLWL